MVLDNIKKIYMAQYQIPASHLETLKKDELTDHIKLLYSYIGTLEKENEEPKIWKSIARRKTEALTHCFPSYNPTFQTCDDKEEIIRMIEEIKKENDELKEKITDMEEKYIAQEDVNDWIESQGQLVVCQDDYENLKEQLDLFTKYFKCETYDELDIYINKLKKENEKLKERQMIMGAIADSHIQDINEIHKDYGDMINKLKKENEKLKSISRN